MLSKEEYKRELVRMWDSLRSDNSPYKGTSSCGGVDCQKCFVSSYCHRSDAYNNAFEVIETVEQWGKENPVITNRDKFREVFGFEIVANYHDCESILCPNDSIDNDCKECPFKGFWGKEYKEPKESEEE